MLKKFGTGLLFYFVCMCCFSFIAVRGDCEEKNPAAGNAKSDENSVAESFLTNINGCPNIWIRFAGIHSFQETSGSSEHFRERVFTIPPYPDTERRQLKWKGNSFSLDQNIPIGKKKYVYTITGIIDPKNKTLSMECNTKATTGRDLWKFKLNDIPIYRNFDGYIAFKSTGAQLRDRLKVEATVETLSGHYLGNYVATDWLGEHPDAISGARKYIPWLIVNFSSNSPEQ